MGPRRMDGFGRPAGAPAGPQQRPAQGQRPMPPQRPVQGQRPVRQPAQRVAPPPQRMAPQPMRGQQRPMPQQGRGQQYQQPAPMQKAKPRKPRSSAWKVVLQFVVGIAVIVGVAGSIVWLYIKYYQQ